MSVAERLAHLESGQQSIMDKLEKIHDDYKESSDRVKALENERSGHDEWRRNMEKRMKDCEDSIVIIEIENHKRSGVSEAMKYILAIAVGLGSAFLGGWAQSLFN